MTLRDYLTDSGISFEAFGVLLEVSQPCVTTWVKNGVPGERCLSVAKATGFIVTPHDLRPDLYPNPTDALPNKPSDQLWREYGWVTLKSTAAQDESTDTR